MATTWSKLKTAYADLPENVRLDYRSVVLDNPSRTDRIHEVWTALQMTVCNNVPNDWDVTLIGHWTPDSGRTVLEFEEDDEVLMLNYKFGSGAQAWVAGHWATLRAVTGKPQSIVFRQRQPNEPTLHHHWDDRGRVTRHNSDTCEVCHPPTPEPTPAETVELSW